MTYVGEKGWGEREGETVTGHHCWGRRGAEPAWRRLVLLEKDTLPHNERRWKEAGIATVLYLKGEKAFLIGMGVR